MALATRSANSGCVLRPVPTAEPPAASSYTFGIVCSIRSRSVGELGHVARELLAQRERHRVHQVGPADLGDVRVLL